MEEEKPKKINIYVKGSKKYEEALARGVKFKKMGGEPKAIVAKVPEPVSEPAPEPPKPKPKIIIKIPKKISTKDIAKTEEAVKPSILTTVAEPPKVKPPPKIIIKLPKKTPPPNVVIKPLSEKDKKRREKKKTKLLKRKKMMDTPRISALKEAIPKQQALLEKPIEERPKGIAEGGIRRRVDLKKGKDELKPPIK